MQAETRLSCNFCPCKITSKRLKSFSNRTKTHFNNIISCHYQIKNSKRYKFTQVRKWTPQQVHVPYPSIRQLLMYSTVPIMAPICLPSKSLVIFIPGSRIQPLMFSRKGSQHWKEGLRHWQRLPDRLPNFWR